MLTYIANGSDSQFPTDTQLHLLWGMKQFAEM